MLSTGLLRDDWKTDTGGVYLRLMLIGALCAPLAAAVVGRSVATAFGLPLATLGAGVVLGATVYATWRVRRARGWGARRVVLDALVVGLLAAVFALVIGWRATGFYTQEVLADAMAVLLMVHVAGALLRAAGLRRQRWPRVTVVAAGMEPGVPRVSEPASMQFADTVTRGMALFVACFWGVAAAGFHEAAGVLLLLGGVSGMVALIARMPSALFNERIDSLLPPVREPRATRTP
jgi:hypothetical protein